MIHSPSERSRLIHLDNNQNNNNDNNDISNISEDVVTLGLKEFSFNCIIVILLWLLSFILVMIHDILYGHLIKSIVFFFIPMWLGSVYSLIAVGIVIRRICTGSNLVSREQRAYLRAQGPGLSEKYIDYESLPLLRSIFMWLVLLTLSSLVIIISQVSFRCILYHITLYIIYYLIYLFIDTSLFMVCKRLYRNVECYNSCHYINISMSYICILN
jgi:hypothetical protein